MFIRSAKKLESRLEITAFHFLDERKDVSVSLTGMTFVPVFEDLHTRMPFFVNRTTARIPLNFHSVPRQNILHRDCLLYFV